MENKNAENKKEEYTGMTAEVIEFNKDDIIATSGGPCEYSFISGGRIECQNNFIEGVSLGSGGVSKITNK